MDFLLSTLSIHELTRIFATSLGCGLLVGLERERSKNTSTEPSFAGLRSFSICSLLGTLCFSFNIAVGIAGTFAVSAFCLYSLIKQNEDIGSTTELSFLMTYFIGALCLFNIPLAAGLTVMLAIILMSKQTLHHFAELWLKDYELRDGLFLLALVLIALPLVPNRALWGPVLNPYVILKLLILILLVQSLAHIAKRLLPENKALILSSLASGFVSSTALIASLGMEVRAGKGSAVSNAGAALMSCVATLIQLLIIVAGINFQWFKLLLFPCLVGCAILIVAALFLIRQDKSDLATTEQNVVRSVEVQRIFSIKEAVIIVLTLTIIQTAVYGMNLMLGNNGLIIGTLLASLFEVHAAIATVVMQGDIHNMTLIYATVTGLAAHAISKCVNAYLTGGTRYFLYFAPAQIIHMACLIAILFFQQYI